MLNDFGDKFQGSNRVPVVELADSEFPVYIEEAKSLGSSVIFDGFTHPNFLSIVFANPWGNEFELSKFHDGGF